jgi:hypothetical protein
MSYTDKELRDGLRHSSEKYYVVDPDELLDLSTDLELSKNDTIRILLRDVTKRLMKSFIPNSFGMSDAQVKTWLKELEDEAFEKYRNFDFTIELRKKRGL